MPKKIIQLIPEHKLYVEPFCGAAWVYFGKPPSKQEVLNDIDSEIVNLFRVAKHHGPEFVRLVNLSPYARDEFKHNVKQQPEGLTEIQRAVRMYYLIKASFASKCTTFGVSLGRNKINMLTLPAIIDEVRDRLNNTIVENLNYADCIKRYDRPDTFFYIDPPYWDCENYYGKGIFAKADYLKLRELFEGLKGRFMMSINDVEEIRSIYAGFRLNEVITRYSANKNENKKVSELLIMNYDPK